MGWADRRRFLRGLGSCGIALAAGIGWTAPRAQPRSRTLAAEPLRGGLVRIDGAGGNIVALETSEGVVLVDSGAAEHADTLARLVADMLDRPVELLFNTHWHLAHTGGNDLFGEAGATIVAHENTRLWMTTEFYVDWEDRTYPRRRSEAWPTRTFRSSDPQPIEIELGGRKMNYAHLKEAHTDGDIYVHFPELNVVVAGGAVSVGQYPVIDYITGGWIGGTIDATACLLELCDRETLIVPQSGPAQRRAHLEAQREMLTAIRERIEEMAVQGMSPAEMFDAGITRDFDAAWGGDARGFLRNAYESMWWTGGRMRGIVA